MGKFRTKWENLGLKWENLEQKWANLGRYLAHQVPRVSITEHRASRVREKMDRAPSIEYSARYSCITIRWIVIPKPCRCLLRPFTIVNLYDARKKKMRFCLFTFDDKNHVVVTKKAPKFKLFVVCYHWVYTLIVICVYMRVGTI